MKKILTALGMLMVFASFTYANEYKLDENKIDGLFNQATEISVANLAADMNSAGSSAAFEDADSKLIIAVIVDFFVGGFGIHRYVLGTASNMWIYYTCTVCGIFGIVPLVDFFVLIIDGIVLKHGDKYMNNQKYFMWA